MATTRKSKPSKAKHAKAGGKSRAPVKSKTAAAAIKSKTARAAVKRGPKSKSPAPRGARKTGRLAPKVSLRGPNPRRKAVKAKPVLRPAKIAKPAAKTVAEFSVSHVDQSNFVGRGLRENFEYRDLGIEHATGGRVGAHVIRVASAEGHATGRHRHKLDFQMIYILNGWARFYYDGQGEITVARGTCVHQPPGIAHDLIDYSDDLEILEIISPAQFATVDA